ncbi:hypothetical protein HNQ51_002197 [Inhella inkyongensis]|uniref:Uncharacterized protein n=1 Tax=Inhella inkyongensis TaxID=392593 RepID=A0A840S5V0_9BURK|nr:hypothetical protein [Inhella inkyongensis]MBB5204878.1 hypothetical protein [Inhella inkyongensis]
MSHPLAIGLSLLVAATAAQAAENRTLSHLRISLSTPEAAVFEAVSAAALPQCLALGSSAHHDAGKSVYQLRGDCYGLSSPTQAEAVRRAMHKAMGKGPGNLEVDVVWKFEMSATPTTGEHAGHGDKSASKKSCPDCEGK